MLMDELFFCELDRCSYIAKTINSELNKEKNHKRKEKALELVIVELNISFNFALSFFSFLSHWSSQSMYIFNMQNFTYSIPRFVQVITENVRLLKKCFYIK